MSEPVQVSSGEVLTVTALPGQFGDVSDILTRSSWHVGDKSPLNLGAGLYEISDGLTYTKSSQAVAALSATLPRATEIIRSERIIRMALADKFKMLADRARTVPAKLSDRADAAFASARRRWNSAAIRRSPGLNAVLTDVETGVSAAEDALNQLTNGAPQ
jgi:hypothetical protein